MGIEHAWFGYRLAGVCNKILPHPCILGHSSRPHTLLTILNTSTLSDIYDSSFNCFLAKFSTMLEAQQFKQNGPFLYSI